MGAEFLDEDLARSLVDAAPDALVLVDEVGRIVFLNRQAEAMFGYDRAELAGEWVEVLLPPPSRVPHAEHRKAFVASPQTRSMGAGSRTAGRGGGGRVL